MRMTESQGCDVWDCVCSACSSGGVLWGRLCLSHACLLSGSWLDSYLCFPPITGGCGQGWTCLQHPVKCCLASTIYTEETSSAPYHQGQEVKKKTYRGTLGSPPAFHSLEHQRQGISQYPDRQRVCEANQSLLFPIIEGFLGTLAGQGFAQTFRR